MSNNHENLPATAETTNNQQNQNQPPHGVTNRPTTTVRSGPSREIAAAFGTARSNVISSGTRRTRSVSGLLPSGSANYQRSLRHQERSIQVQAAPAEPEQQPSPPHGAENLAAERREEQERRIAELRQSLGSAHRNLETQHSFARLGGHAKSSFEQER